MLKHKLQQITHYKCIHTMYKDEKVGVHELLMFKSNQKQFQTLQHKWRKQI